MWEGNKYEVIRGGITGIGGPYTFLRIECVFKRDSIRLRSCH